VCRTAACTVATCDRATHTCGQANTYKYQVTQFSLGTRIACTRCAAASYPWLFVVGSSGLVAFNVSNPTDNNPPKASIAGLSFTPTQVVQSGARIWLLGAPNAGGAATRLPIAYIDPPSDPFATQLTAQSVSATYNRPVMEAITLFPRAGASALLVGPATSQYPSAFVEAPLVDPVNVNTTALPFVPNTNPYAVSGRRLLMGGTNNTLETFNFVDNAGGPNPANNAVITMNNTGSVSASQRVASSGDGAVFWATGVVEGVDILARTRAVRGHFVVANETGPIEANVGLDVEPYDQGIGPDAPVAGPVAMLDGQTALVSAQAHEANLGTAVQFVTRTPLAIVQQGAVPRRQVLPIGVTSFVAAAASNGIAYLIANDQAPPQPGTVFAFDPGCSL
jgi:hypothetical protein